MSLFEVNDSKLRFLEIFPWFYLLLALGVFITETQFLLFELMVVDEKSSM